MRVIIAISALLLLTACNKQETAETPEEKPAAATEAKPETKAPQMPNKPEPIAAPEDVAAAPADATKTASGLAYKFLTKGTATEKPTKEDTVEVHYTGWTKDGKMFDSSVARGEKISFPLNRVIPGWTEGVQLMSVGDKVRFWIPGNMA